MESSDAHRIHSKEKMLFHAKNVFFVHILTDILFVYHYFALFWQNKNENSSSNLLHVCCFGFHPQQNQKRTSHILFSTISRNCYELMIRDRREIYSHGLWGGAFENV